MIFCSPTVLIRLIKKKQDTVGDLTSSDSEVSDASENDSDSDSTT